MKKIFSPKRHFTILAAVVLLVGGLSLVSCEKLLEEKLHGVYDAKTYFTTPSLTDMAVLGVYEVFSDLNTYGQNAMVYDTDTDIAYVQGITGTGHIARDLGHYNIYASHAWLEASWNLYYKGINRANTIVEGVKQYTYSAEDSAKITILVGEAKLLRALCYFDLVRLFGDVPYTNTPSELGDNLKLPQTGRDTIYNYIVQDMKDAFAALPWERASTERKPAIPPCVRATKGVAAGMLARINLFRAGYSLRPDGNMRRPSNYRDYYQEAIRWTEEVITSGYYELNPSYERLFRNYCEWILEPKESMFEIDFFNTSGESLHSGTWGTYNGPAITQGSSYRRANSFIKTHTVFYNWFEAGDKRRDVAIGTFSIGADDVVSQISPANGFNWAPGKWRRNWQLPPYKDNNNTDANAVLLRYADVLLMRAEAENEINGPDAAIPYINRVRERAFGGVSGNYNSATFGGSKDLFFAELKKERARELCFEPVGRRADLIRWNALGRALIETRDAIGPPPNYTGMMGTFSYKAPAERFNSKIHNIYPIPARELRENPNLKQNYGYGNS